MRLSDRLRGVGAFRLTRNVASKCCEPLMTSPEVRKWERREPEGKEGRRKGRREGVNEGWRKLRRVTNNVLFMQMFAAADINQHLDTNEEETWLWRSHLQERRVA